ncbi:hypothetical protein WG906_05235 [Pedobacter sp. P351]|uniref:hypothetical protein n=1 Tax=Pedobacter superstes TaxID=3133441 RepID=UPI0030A07A15
MKKVIAQAQFKLVTLISTITFVLFSLIVVAQAGNNPNQHPEKSSPAEQSSAYLQSIENDPNGVPNNSAWYAQPWLWAIVAAILILVVGLIFKSYGKRDVESEQGL